MSPVLMVPPDVGVASLHKMSSTETSEASRCSGNAKRNCPSSVGFLFRNIQSTVLSALSTLSTLPM